jgi:hypothetical protein
MTTRSHCLCGRCQAGQINLHTVQNSLIFRSRTQLGPRKHTSSENITTCIIISHLTVTTRFSVCESNQIKNGSSCGCDEPSLLDREL